MTPKRIKNIFSKHDILNFHQPDMSYNGQICPTNGRVHSGRVHQKKMLSKKVCYLPCITKKRIKNIFSKHDILNFHGPDQLVRVLPDLVCPHQASLFLKLIQHARDWPFICVPH